MENKNFPSHLSLGMRAHRSGYATHFDDELMALEGREKQEIDEERAEELAAIAEIATLADHPGYQKMRDARLKTIAHYRSGAAAKAASIDPEVSNAKFGELVRMMILVADELEKELLTVESAVEAVEEEKAAKRERSKRKVN